MNATEEITQQMKDEFVGAAHGDVERVREMLEQNPGLATSVASWGETAIEAAAQMANREIADMLLAASAPLDICTAAVFGMADRVEAILEEDSGQINATGAHGIPLMYYPVVGGHREMAEMLLRRGADINAGEGMNTALHGAAMFNQLDMAKWLISHKANTAAKDYEGRTPLDLAVSSGNQEMAELLQQGDSRQ